MTIEVVEFIQSMQNGFFDLFFNFISFLGEEYVYIFIISIIYFTIDKKAGEFVSLTLFTTTGINNILKGLVQAPRPFEKYPNRVNNLRPSTSTGHSFPSGHTQSFTSFLFGGYYFFKNNYLLVIAILLSILMAVSRMYLGVHFLEDVITSIVLGILIAYVLHKVYEKYYDNEKVLHYIYIWIAIFMTIFVFILDDEDFFTSYGLIIGFVFAMWFEKKYVQFTISSTLTHKIIRVLVGLVIMLIIQVGLKPVFELIQGDQELLTNIFRALRYGLVSFIGLGLYPMLFKKFRF